MIAFSNIHKKIQSNSPQHTFTKTNIRTYTDICDLCIQAHSHRPYSDYIQKNTYECIQVYSECVTFTIHCIHTIFSTCVYSGHVCIQHQQHSVSFNSMHTHDNSVCVSFTLIHEVQPLTFSRNYIQSAFHSPVCIFTSIHIIFIIHVIHYAPHSNNYIANSIQQHSECIQ